MLLLFWHKAQKKTLCDLLCIFTPHSPRLVLEAIARGEESNSIKIRVNVQKTRSCLAQSF